MRSRAHIFEGEQKAIQLIADLGFDVPGPIPVDDLAYFSGLRIVMGPLDGADARLTRFGPSGLVRLTDRYQDPQRKRFSIGHEIGHWTCDQQSVAILSCEGGVDNTVSDSESEQRANAFASELLMPKTLVEPMLARKELSLSIIQHVSDVFEVSLTAAALRFLRLTSESVYVLRVAKNGRFSWWQRSAKAGLSFSRQMQAHPLSLAHEVLSGNTTGSQLRLVQTSAWFPELFEGKRAEVREISIPMGSHGGALTLLSTVEYEVERRSRFEDSGDDE